MIRIEQASKKYHSGEQTYQALIDINLHLHKGEFLVLLGSNGSGKSTLLKTLTGRVQLDAGCILLDDTDITMWKEHRRAALISCVVQDPLQGTVADMSVAENLALAYRRGQLRGLAAGITSHEQELFRESLARLGLGLEDRLQVKAGQLSGGQRQALTLVMATLCRPKLLLLDEHTAALDPKTAQRVLELSCTIIHDQNLTAIMVTHQLRDAARLGSRIAVMKEGRIVFEAAAEQKKMLTPTALLDLVSD